MGNSNLYQLRVEAALEYIDNNISADLSLKCISNAAGFSPYHFHRIFRAITGKNLHDYILERKLRIAANKLLYEVCDITKIALDTGFSTPSAFSKCFKDMFECTPTQFKEQADRKYPAEFAKITFPEFVYDDEIERSFYEIHFTDLQTLCIGVTGLSESWENPQIESAYHRIFDWIHNNSTYNGSVKICGITVDTPEVQALCECRYYACAAIDTCVYSDSLASRKFNTSGQYICCNLLRSKQNFTELFFKHMQYLYGFYLQQHGLFPDNRPFVEFYESDNNNITITFCVPVKRARI